MNNKFNPHKTDRHGTKYKVVPKALRKRVYVKLREVNNANEEMMITTCFGKHTWDRGLCVSLIEYLREFDESYPPFCDSVDTNLLFPEFGLFIGFVDSPYHIKWKSSLYEENIIQWRKEIIRNCIELCD